MTEQKKTNIIRKLFGGINLTWPRLIIASVVIGLIVGAIMINPDWKDTSISQIGVGFSWWVLFGTIIIANSKSNIDSALKCFVFFLISQPLIYLVQVPFAEMGWGLFGYYRYWAIWTVLTLPMGFIGYYIKRSDIWSALILSGPLFILLIEGIGFITPADGEMNKYFAMGILSLIFAVLILYGVLKDIRLWLIPIVIGSIAGLIYVAPWNGGSEGQVAKGSYDLTTFLPEVDNTWSVTITNDKYNVQITKDDEKYFLDVEYRNSSSVSNSLIDFTSPDGETVYTCSFTTHLDNSAATFGNCEKQ